MPIAALNKKKIQEVTIYKATKKFVPLQIPKSISVVWKCLINMERTYSKGFKFTMFSLVLSGTIPFEY